MNRSDLPFWSGSNSQFLTNLKVGGYQTGLAQAGSTQMPWQADQGGSQQLQIFKDSLREVASLSVIGINTLSGVSPKSQALEGMIVHINDITSPDEQVAAVDDLLREGDKLWSDQFAHILARMVQEVITPGRLNLQEHAQTRMCNRVLQASLRLAPDLLPDSVEQDVLKTRVNLMVERCGFAFARGINATLEECGFLEPVSDVKYRGAHDESPEGLANWLKNEIIGMSNRRIVPDDLSMLLDYAVTLPDDLRGRILAMMVNLFWNTMRTPENEQLNLEIGYLVDELPLKSRITPLEAFYNQLNRLPHEIARPFFPLALKSISRLPDMQDFRFNRSKRDLLDSVRWQGQVLEEGDFRGGESLVVFDQRVNNVVLDESTIGWN